jgi:hypothetical protein
MRDKRRNAQAVAAWSRHGGAHNPGTKRPDVDDTDEQLLDIMVEGSGVMEIDGELYEIEFEWDDEEDDDGE